MPPPIDLSVVKRGLDAKTSPQLIDILSFTQDDNPAAIPLIKDILLDRGVTKEDIVAFESSYTKLKKDLDSQPKINKPANFGSRFFNYFIDHFICYGFIYLLQSYAQFTKNDEGLYYGIAIGIYVMYYSLTIALFKGTFGMMVIGLKVVYAKSNKPADFFAGFIRGVFMVLNFLTLQIGHLIMLGDKNKRTLVDRATDTSVVYK
jgi:uncharacterized RDD family membrane protein YckC